MEDWLFANQPTLTPTTSPRARATSAQVTDFDARYQTVLEPVKADIGLRRRARRDRRRPSSSTASRMLQAHAAAAIFDAGDRARAAKQAARNP